MLMLDNEDNHLNVTYFTRIFEEVIEITSWLVSAYDFYSRVVKNRKRTSERSERVSLRFFTTSE